MSQRLGMADGRCFTINSSAQLFNNYVMKQNNHFLRGQLFVPSASPKVWTRNALQESRDEQGKTTAMTATNHSSMHPRFTN